MSRILRVVLAVLLVAAGIAGVVAILAGEGLDRAEKWVSIGGITVSVVLSALGLGVAWLAWRHPADGPSPDRAGPDAVAPPHVDARGSRGVQIGDHNTQHNTF